MEELSNLVTVLDLEDFVGDILDLSYINVFKNPNKLPITQIHLEKTSVQLRRDAPIDSANWSKETESRCFDKKIEIVPALSKVWLPESLPVFPYKPHTYEKKSCSDQNRKFLQTIHYLLSCNYHQFWCTVLFEPRVQRVLHSFLLSPILPHQIKYLDQDDDKLVYLAVLSHFRKVYERLLTFQETELEYMPDRVALKYLLEKKLLNLPIVVTLTMLYHETNLNFVNDLVSLYFSEQSVFQDKEIDELITQVIMTLEMIGGHVCGFEDNAVIVPIAVEPKPLVFNIEWVHSVVNYLLNTISSVNMLLKFYKNATKKALDKGLPYRLSYTYEKVFQQLYEFINERKELEENQILSDVIYEEIALARSQFIDVYNCFITYCFDKVLEFSGDSIRQQDFIEIYLQLVTAALEDEYFICDYHERYDVGAQNEMFSSCTEIDDTRTQYILDCITCLKRHNRLWKALKCELKTLEKTREKYGKSQNVRIDRDFGHQNGQASQTSTSRDVLQNEKPPPSDAEIEESILKVIDMFPHLGDGFVLECLKVYNFQADEVITAILEENLPPHLVAIPFDEIRIPPETSPIRPKLEEIKGKKSSYDDALKLLNDKKDVKQIKTFILDGIQYTNEYDDYDDEYDDRIDEATVPVRDHGTEDILKYNPNYDDAVSDTSYSEEEYDESGAPVQQNQKPSNSKGKANFCEDPAAVRARQEARRQATGRGRPPPRKQDVVGKAKGQGQDKSVLVNRDKKNTNKSSRANHNRRSGAQWKRNRGMIPS